MVGTITTATTTGARASPVTALDTPDPRSHRPKGMSLSFRGCPFGLFLLAVSTRSLRLFAFSTETLPGAPGDRELYAKHAAG